MIFCGFYNGFIVDAFNLRRKIMGSISVIQALIIAVWVASIMGRFLLGGATLTMRFSPMM